MFALDPQVLGFTACLSQATRIFKTAKPKIALTSQIKQTADNLSWQEYGVQPREREASSGGDTGAPGCSFVRHHCILLGLQFERCLLPLPGTLPCTNPWARFLQQKRFVVSFMLVQTLNTFVILMPSSTSLLTASLG